MTSFRCSRCGLDLSPEAFSPSKRKPGSWCRACSRAHDRAYRATHLDRFTTGGRYWKPYQPRPPRPEPEPTERLDALRTVTPTGCWLSTGTHDSKGRPVIYLGQAQHLLTRWAWAVLVGPLDDTTQLRHACREVWCWNPDHLRAQPTRKVRRVWPGAVDLETK